MTDFHETLAHYRNELAKLRLAALRQIGQYIAEADAAIEDHRPRDAQLKLARAAGSVSAHIFSLELEIRCAESLP